MDALAVARLLDRSSNERWGNLGAWEPGDAYGQAARRLARELGEQAGLESGLRVLDIGCGCGEQIAVWLREFGAEEVVALEPDPAALAAARARVEACGLADRVTFVEADARQLAVLEGSTFDRVLALDCAYLFGDREGWLREVFRLLRPGGVLAVTDLVLAAGKRGPLLAQLSPIFGIARDHWIDADAYRQACAEAGFSEVDLKWATDRVLGGFGRHVRGRLAELASAGSAGVPVLLTAAACALALRRSHIGYAFVRAVG